MQHFKNIISGKASGQTLKKLHRQPPGLLVICKNILQNRAVPIICKDTITGIQQCITPGKIPPQTNPNQSNTFLRI
jgi:hypothetical protein